MAKFHCYTCDGAGEWDEGPLPATSSAQLYPDCRRVICPDCRGKGSLASPMCCMCRDTIEGEFVRIGDAVWCKACHEQFTEDMASVG
jgi:hypothetical protein